MIQSRMSLVSLLDEDTASKNLIEINALRNEGFKIVAYGETEAFAWFMLEKGLETKSEFPPVLVDLK